MYTMRSSIDVVQEYILLYVWRGNIQCINELIDKRKTNRQENIKKDRGMYKKYRRIHSSINVVPDVDQEYICIYMEYISTYLYSTEN